MFQFVIFFKTLPYSVVLFSLFLTGLFLSGGFTQAQTRPNNESYTVLTAENKSAKKHANEIGLSLNTSSIDSTNFEAQYNFKSASMNQKSSVELTAGLYPENNFSYVAIPEAYFSESKYLKNESVEIEYAIGRKKTISNFLDNQFNLGLINPYFSQDLIHYKTEGLIGFHSSVGNHLLKLGANYYPIFLPNQGPSSKEQDGKIKGANHWASGAPETFIYNGKENSVKYAIDDYNLSDLAAQPGYSVTLQSGDVELTNIEFNVTYSDKPTNDIVLSRTVIADLNLNGAVKLYPIVRYSDKITTDLKIKNNNLTYFASYLMDAPRNRLEKDDRAVQVLEQINGYGAGVTLDLSDYLDRAFSVTTSYGRFFGGSITDTDSDGVANTFNISNQRLIYQQPFKFNLAFESFKISSRSVYLNVDWIYDSIQRGSLLSFKASHQPASKMNLSLGFDVIGIADETDLENKKLFLGKHSADDRVTGAIEYVF
jgi:hypothetical protein